MEKVLARRVNFPHTANSPLITLEGVEIIVSSEMTVIKSVNQRLDSRRHIRVIHDETCGGVYRAFNLNVEHPAMTMKPGAFSRMFW